MTITPENSLATGTAEQLHRAWLGRIVGGSYRLVRAIGSGGSANVFEAEHIRLGKSFAVKVLRTEVVSLERSGKRFHREARAIAKVESEYVVSIVDAGELEDGTPYLVTELLQGEDLRALLRKEGALPMGRATHIAIDVCQGLVQVHAAGLVHRDLKPENLFITRRAEGQDWCKLLDFGVAKMEASQATAHGAIVGTIRYMAPEQLADNAEVNAATDVYALGLVLYECLAGRPAHAGATVQELMYQVMNVRPPSLGQLRPELPESLLSLVERCIQKRPEGRPQSARELLALLRAQVAHAGTNEVTLSETLSETLFDAPVSRVASRGRTRLRVLPASLAAFALGGALVGIAHPGAQGPAAATPARSAEAKRFVPALAQPFPTQQASAVTPMPSFAAVSAATSVMTAAAPRASTSARGSTLRREARPSLPSSGRELSVGRFDRANPYGE